MQQINGGMASKFKKQMAKSVTSTSQEDKVAEVPKVSNEKEKERFQNIDSDCFDSYTIEKDENGVLYIPKVRRNRLLHFFSRFILLLTFSLALFLIAIAVIFVIRPAMALNILNIIYNFIF